MKKLSILLLSLLTVACVTGGYNPRYYYNEIQVVNLTGGTIVDVKVQIGESGRTVSCDSVLKNTLCDERFGKRRYPQQGIQLSWTHTDGSQKSQLLTPAISVHYFTAFPLRIMLEISENGAVKAYFQQEEPGRDRSPIFTDIM